MAKIVIKYGQYKEGYAFGRASYNSRSDKVHLVLSEAFNSTAVCGKGTYGTMQFMTGWLCADCAKGVDVKTPDDFDVMESEYEWGLAQGRED